MHFTACIAAGLFATGMVVPTMAQEKPGPGEVSIDSTQVTTSPGTDQNYNGCPRGSVGSALAQDYSFMTLIFDKLTAQIGPGTPARGRRVVCSVNVQIQSPDGWQYCAETADYRGYYALGDGVNGTIKASYDFGMGEQGRIEKGMKGPINTDFLLHREGEVAHKVWSPCHNRTSNFKVKLSIALASRKRDANGLIVTDSADAKFKQTLNLDWRKCE